MATARKAFDRTEKDWIDWKTSNNDWKKFPETLTQKVNTARRKSKTTSVSDVREHDNQ